MALSEVTGTVTVRLLMPAPKFTVGVVWVNFMYWLSRPTLKFACCAALVGLADSSRGVPTCTTKPLLSAADSPPVWAVRLRRPVGASAVKLRVRSAVVAVTVDGLSVAVMPEPRLKVVEEFQWVPDPVTWTATPLAPCCAVFGVTVEITATPGETWTAVLTTSVPVVAVMAQFPVACVGAAVSVMVYENAE